MTQDWSARKRYAPGSPWLLASLVVCCLVPRAAMGLKLDAVCNDAVFYVDLARHYEQGDLAAGLGRLGLNVYPPVLAALHQLGVSWENAGKWWGIAAASLAVLPLYGWVRRQFDGRTALAGAMLYAFHPKLIEWSPELLRDPTFWLLWSLGLYASWRAAQEQTWRWYFMAGLAIAVAAHTRFEGWFLYLPLVGWSAWRLTPAGLNSRARLADMSPSRLSLRERTSFRGAKGDNDARLAIAHGYLDDGFGSGASWRRVAAGVLLCVAVSPLLVVLANVTLLRDLSRWELGNFERLDYVAQWWQAAWSAPASPIQFSQIDASDGRLSLRERTPFRGAKGDEQAAAQPPAEITERMPVSRMMRLYGNALRRGFGALFGILWLVGIVVGRRRLLRADHAILFPVAACIAAAAWIHLWYGQATSSRYFLAIALLACPCSATGGLWVYDRLMALFAGLQTVRWRRPAATAALVLATMAAGVGESLADRHDGRSREAWLGRWLLAEFGPASRIATIGPMPRIGFYARTTPSVLSPAEAALMDLSRDGRFDALVALRSGANEPRLEPMIERARASGYQAVEGRRLPPGYRWADLVLLVRHPPTSGVRHDEGEPVP
ncbi:MAG TPA: glycosyltransferase family 39 protein [Pirellulales bacterium]|nr:glycosyltransferase family 39 protein [Pirellulales bacterium]